MFIYVNNLIAKRVCDAYLTSDVISQRACDGEKGKNVQIQPSKKQLRRERAEQKRLNNAKNKKQKTATVTNTDTSNSVVVLNDAGEVENAKIMDDEDGDEEEEEEEEDIAAAMDEDMMQEDEEEEEED